MLDPYVERFTEWFPAKFLHSTARRTRTIPYLPNNNHRITAHKIRALRSFADNTHSAVVPQGLVHSSKIPCGIDPAVYSTNEGMAYTKDYYSILGLSASKLGSSGPTSTAVLRRAYKLALLAAHPDKQTAATLQARGYTVDEVKEAFTVLADQKSKTDYDNWLLRHLGVARGQGQTQPQAPSSDFVLGLELLDLSDFDVLDPNYAFSEAPSTSTSAAQGGDGEEQMEWTRACRCGADKGFRILEEELEDAESRGEKEVLVGCEGCSLWVRVGFEVEEG